MTDEPEEQQNTPFGDNPCFEYDCAARQREHPMGSDGCTSKLCWAAHYGEPENTTPVQHLATEECPECSAPPDPNPDGFKLSLSDLQDPELLETALDMLEGDA